MGRLARGRISEMMMIVVDLWFDVRERYGNVIKERLAFCYRFIEYRIHCYPKSSNTDKNNP